MDFYNTICKNGRNNNPPETSRRTQSFLTRDLSGTPMQENILFDPAAAWLSQSLQCAKRKKER